MVSSKIKWLYLTVCFLLCLVLLCVLFLINRTKAETITSGEWVYENFVYQNGMFHYNAATIVEYTGTNKDITIPSTIDGLPVKAVKTKSYHENGGGWSRKIVNGDVIYEYYGGYSHKGIIKNNTVENVTIPESINSISEEAFANCDSIKTVTINARIDSIGPYAFAFCDSLIKINIPYGVKAIEESAFENCASLPSIEIPDSVEQLGGCCFSGCKSLKSIKIPSGIKELYGTFEACTALTSIELPSSINKISGTFQCCTSLETITLPNSLSAMGDRCFYGCESLKKVIIPESIQTIGRCSFYECKSLKDIVFPRSLKTIEEEAFSGCTSLSAFVLPDGLETIGRQAFKSCSSLEALVIPSSVKSISFGAFNDCGSLSQVIFKEGITEIGGAAFYNCDSLTTIILPDSLESVTGEGAFGDCDNLENVSLGEGLTVIPEFMFYGSSVNRIYVPKAVTKVESGNIDGSKAKTREKGVYIYYQGSYDEFFHTDLIDKYGREVTIIDQWGELSSSGLVQLHLIPNSTNPINDDPLSFRKTGILRKGEGWNLNWTVTYYENANKPGKNATLRINLTGDTLGIPNIHIEDNLGELAVGANQPWITQTGLKETDFTQLVVSGIKESSLILPNNIFKGYSNVTSATLKYVSSIGSNAFANCRMLDSLSLDDSIGIIEASAFENTGIKKINLGYALTKVGDSAFNGCAQLKTTRYEGTRSEWNKLDIGDNNAPLWDSLECTFMIGDKRHLRDLDYYASNVQSASFNSSLCKLMAGLSCSAYNSEQLRDSYKALGFTNWKTYTKGIHATGKDLDYSIGEKTTKEGDSIVLIIIRGSSSLADWLRDFSMAEGSGNYSVHSGFQDASDVVIQSLIEKNGEPNPADNTKYFVTGHSLGAAVSNLVATEISSYVGKEDVYCYDFACPDTVAIDNNKVGVSNPFNVADSHNNIFNICNDQDIVTYVPGMIGSAVLVAKNAVNITRYLTTYTWGKVGITKWFDDDSYDFLNPFVHDQNRYYDYVSEKDAIYYDSYSHPHQVEEAIIGIGLGTVMAKHPVLLGITAILVYCPVDIEVVDSEGNIIAYTKNGIPYYNDYDKGVFIITSEDRKAVCYSEHEDYHVKLTATDDGEMSLVTVDLNGDNVDSIKLFQDVSLKKDKQMAIDPVETSVEESRLYTTNEDEEPIKEIHEDGTEAKVGVTDLNINTIMVERDEEGFVLKPGSTKQIKALFQNADGDIIEKPATWISSDAQVATVSETGLVTAVSTGIVTITVSVDEKAMDIPITVSTKKEEPVSDNPVSSPDSDNQAGPSNPSAGPSIPSQANNAQSSNHDAKLNGIVQGPDGKWAMYKDNKVDTSYTGIAQNNYGWWRVKDGYVDFDAQGIYQNEYGWWKTTNGKVTFNETGIFKNEYGWWRVKDSKVDFKAQGIYQNKYGWWKTTNGKVTFKENGIFQNEYGWWKVKDSKVDFTYTGVASNKYGNWYIKNGIVDFSKNGKVRFNSHSYMIKNGKVQ